MVLLSVGRFGEEPRARGQRACKRAILTAGGRVLRKIIPAKAQ